MHGNFVKGRADRVAELENFPAIRDAAAAIRDRAVRNLEHYLEAFKRNTTARGAVVHWVEAAGVQVVKTALGAYILQLAKESPSHFDEPVNPLVLVPGQPY